MRGIECLQAVVSSSTIEKPPGMRWQTFDRLLEKVEAAEGMIGGHAGLLVDVLIREIGEQGVASLTNEDGSGSP